MIIASRSNSHEARLRKLGALLARRASIETSIIAHTRVMEKAWVETTEKYALISAGRSQDLMAK